MRLKEIKNGMVVHCKTQEEANQLCDAVGGSGNWKEYWIHNEDDTCYQILSNGISSYGKSISYGSKIITEFSDLVIPELSAEEALLAYDQMCKENYCCNDCPIYGILGHECAHKMEGHITEIMDAIKKWKYDHEKKEPEVETVYICRIIEIQPDGHRRCVHEEDLASGSTDAEIKILVEAELKRYCMEHDGEFIAVHEVVSRVKEKK